ncbi:MAG: rod shape-determining protein MreC [Eudoraea sp.]|nr:rod shape-determining protein MreC [Eudoraea sp.]
MQQIINFILRNKTTLFFVFLLAVSLSLSIQSHSYHRSRFFNSSNWIVGNVYSTQAKVSSYFKLKETSDNLLKENTDLRTLLFNTGISDTATIDTKTFQYVVIPGQVIKNSYAQRNNYITINRGKSDGIEQDMGVITSNGVLGIVEHTTNKFASVQSILNTKSNINAKIKNTNNFGSLKWDANRYDMVQLEDIPRMVPLLIGDTIVTGAMSSIFPENIPIGTIKKFNLNASESFYTIDVGLFNDMTNLNKVYIINNTYRSEIQELEEKIANDQ